MVVVSFTFRPPYTGSKCLDKREGWVLVAAQKQLDFSEMTV
jgi:hypothetical protein